MTRLIFLIALGILTAACAPTRHHDTIGHGVRRPHGMCSADNVTVDNHGRTRCAHRRY